MKKLHLFIIAGFMICMMTPVFAQVGINTDGSDPDPSSILDLKSTDKGLLIPRMTSAEAAAIASPVDGLMIYQTDDLGKGRGFYYYNGSNWDYIANSTNLMPPNVVLVTSVSDFPDAVSGVIQLANNISYQISGNVNIGANTINLGTLNTIYGINKSDDKLVYTGTGAMITSTNQEFTIKSITMSAAGTGSQIFDITGSTSNIQIEGSIFRNSKSIGTFDGGNILVFDNNLFAGNEGGLEVKGNIENIFFRNNVSDGNVSGTVLSIPSGNSDVLQILGNYFEVATGQTALNINAGIINEYGVVSNNLFKGAGTYLSGIAPTTLKWIFQTNVGVADSDAYGFYRFWANTTETTISATYPTYYKASGISSSAKGERFDYSVNNRLTYIGIKDINAKFVLNGSIQGISKNENIRIAICKNGTIILEEVEIRASNADQPYGMGLNGSVDMKTNDYLEIWVSNLSSIENVLIADFQFRVEK